MSCGLGFGNVGDIMLLAVGYMLPAGGLSPSDIKVDGLDG